MKIIVGSVNNPLCAACVLFQSCQACMLLLLSRACALEVV